MTARMSRLSSVVCDPKRRDRLLGLSAAQFSTTSAGDSVAMNDFKEDDVVWGWMELEDHDSSSKRVDHRHILSAKLDSCVDPVLRMQSGGSRWVCRNTDPMGMARGLSGISHLRESTPSRIASCSRRISFDAAGGSRSMLPQSLPVNVPDWSKILGSENENHNTAKIEALIEDEEERLPPHELLARQSTRSEMTSFSVFEGAGRTLKGRDLSRVRYAVLRQTGFIDS